MSKFQIPIADATAPNFSLQVDLDGATYTLAFRYDERRATDPERNEQQTAWFVSLLDESEQDHLRDGVMIEVSAPDDDVAPLFPRQLPGYLAAVSAVPMTGAMDDLTTLELWYVEAADRAAELA